LPTVGSGLEDIGIVVDKPGTRRTACRPTSNLVGGLDERGGELAGDVTADAVVRVEIDRNPAIRLYERVEPNMIFFKSWGR
jgi:hypothetical protein